MKIFSAGRCWLDLKFIILRHLFKQHQPQRFFAGGEEEGIAAGLGPCQVFPGEITDEGGGGFVDQHPLAVVDEHAVADACAWVDFDAGGVVKIRYSSQTIRSTNACLP